MQGIYTASELPGKHMMRWQAGGGSNPAAILLTFRLFKYLQYFTVLPTGHGSPVQFLVSASSIRNCPAGHELRSMRVARWHIFPRREGSR